MRDPEASQAWGTLDPGAWINKQRPQLMFDSVPDHGCPRRFPQAPRRYVSAEWGFLHTHILITCGQLGPRQPRLELIIVSSPPRPKGGTVPSHTLEKRRDTTPGLLITNATARYGLGAGSAPSSHSPFVHHPTCAWPATNSILVMLTEGHGLVVRFLGPPVAHADTGASPPNLCGSDGKVHQMR